MVGSVSSAGRLLQIPPRRLNAPPTGAVRLDLNQATAGDLVRVAGFSPDEAKAAVAARRRRPILTAADLGRVAAISSARLRALAERVVPLFLDEVTILDVEAGRVMSERPWLLEVSFRAPRGIQFAVGLQPRA